MNILFVGFGGFIGASLRYLSGQLIPPQNGFPIHTLIINLLGCFALSWFYSAAFHRWNIAPHIRLGIGTGLIGAFTTFSTFSVETLQLLHNGQIFLCLSYILTSTIGGIVFSAGGIRLSHLIDIRNGERDH